MTWVNNRNLAELEAWRHVLPITTLNLTVDNAPANRKKGLVYRKMANRGYDVVVDVDEGVSQPFNLNFNPCMLISPRATWVIQTSNKTTSNFTLPVCSRNSPTHSISDLSLPDFNDPSNPRSKILPDTSTPFGTTQNPTPSKRFLWTLSFYAQFFDVDTSEVLRRCTASLYPRAPFLDILDGNPDLYGPFWIATTLVFILFIAATISQYLSRNHDIHFEYNFALLSGAAGLIYGYTGFLPVGLWALLRWFGAESATLVECWALYGYANVIWIPVAIISWSPISILNYVFTAIGFAVSVVFLVRNLWPVVSVTDAKISRVLLIAVVVLHAGLAIAIKFTFFA